MKYFAICLGLFCAAAAPAQTVRFNTSQGNIDVILLPESAPLTVANFLNYVNKGAYNDSFVHRSVAGFIWQGGGYTYRNNQLAEIPSDPPVRNEYRISNTRGTIAMAKLGDNPNSATNQWFFNLSNNNASNLNNQNGGFTVFGRVADTASLAIMDRIANIPVYNAGSPFDTIPLVNPTGNTITAANLVLIRSITILTPTIAGSGVIAASNFGGGSVAARGSYIEIYGTNLASATRGWATADFTEGRAPTTLEGVSVTVGGKPAFVNYVSPGQINVQVPADVELGEMPVVVTTRGQASEPVNLEIRERQPSLLAPASFKIGENHYAAAVHASDGGLVGNGTVPNVPNAPAVPGETLTFYGLGFGPVTEGSPIAGQIAQGQTSISVPVEFEIGGLRAQTSYAGLAPNLVGVYQFNVVVPSGTPSGDQPLRVTVDGQPISQSLVIPVQ